MTREHCQAPAACVAKKAGRHCIACTAAIPEVRARRIESAREAQKNPELRRKRSERARARGADPEYRAKMSAAKKLALQDPAKRARVIEGLLKTVQTRRVYRGLASGLNEQERAKYLDLTKRRRFMAAEARAIIDRERTAEARRIIARITADMHAKEARRKAQAY